MLHITSNQNDIIEFDSERLSKRTKLKLTYYQIPFSFYNVSSDFLTNSFDADVTTITLTSGQYSDPDDLRLELETQLQTYKAGFSVTYNEISKKFTISETANFDLDFTDSNIGNLIGFTSNKTGASTYTSDETIDLTLGIRNIYMVIREFETEKSYKNNQGFGFDFRFPINNSYLGDILYPESKIMIKYNKVTLKLLSKSSFKTEFFVYIGDSKYYIDFLEKNYSLDFKMI